MKYSGIIKHIRKSTSNGWAAIVVELDNGLVIPAAGSILNPCVGYEIELEGEIVVSKYGEQIKVTSASMSVTKTKDGIISYLTSGLVKGIGPVTAEAMYAKYGNDVIDIFKKDPDKLLEFKGISQKKRDKIIKSLLENERYEKLCKLCNKITPNQAIKILERYGDKAEEIIQENPYQLIYDIDGIGFLKADFIARSMGLSDESQERVGAAIVYVLKTLSETEGHCFADLELLSIKGIELLSPVPGDMVTSRLERKFNAEVFECAENWDTEKDKLFTKYDVSVENQNRLDEWQEKRLRLLGLFADVIVKEVEAEHLYVEDNERVYITPLYKAEVGCSEIITNLIKSKPVKYFKKQNILNHLEQDEKRNGYPFGEEQKSAVLTSLINRFSIITGGPGRGKTTIIKEILDIWGSDEDIVLCAPTGRAAQRMKESTGRNANTIHRTITFENPVNKLVIVDECSMLDISLAYKLLEWVSKYDNNLILVGDKDQLPSIGAGNFFSDLILSKMIPTVILNQGYRNDGSIAKNSEKINKGASTKMFIYDDDFKFKEVAKENMQEEVINAYVELNKIYNEKDICILTPMRQRSTSGANILNELIRDRVNPENPRNPKLNNCKFRLYDRIMQTKNNTKKEVEKDGVVQYGVYNGDCGKIIDIDRVFNTLTVEFDDGRIAEFDEFETEDFILAYAMTIHKSQGSEYAAVIITMTTEHYIMLQRNLLYTAETRAKNIVEILGNKKALSMAIRNTDYKERNSRLRARISDMLTN